jgi:hypothetical protein
MTARGRVRFLPVLALLWLPLATCGSLTRFGVSAEGHAVVLRGTPLETLLGQLGFEDFATFDITQQEEFRNQGYKRSQIDSVKLKRLLLSVEDPPGQTCDFLDRISFFAEAEGLPRVEIARLDPIPRDSNEIDLEILDVELADHATAESMSIVTEASGRRPENDTTIFALVDLEVDVNVTAACR